MEGALPSVVGGLVDKPVIAVPTSVGYGAHFHGLAPLLAMLNSCAAGIAVVNIDNGFGAGDMAHSINLIGETAAGSRQRRHSAAHGSLPRQFGAGETVAVADHTILQTGYGLPPSSNEEHAMRVAYIHGYEGITGPLLLGACLDAGATLASVAQVWHHLGLPAGQGGCPAHACPVPIPWQRR